MLAWNSPKHFGNICMHRQSCASHLQRWRRWRVLLRAKHNYQPKNHVKKELSPIPPNWLCSPSRFRSTNANTCDRTNQVSYLYLIAFKAQTWLIGLLIMSLLYDSCASTKAPCWILAVLLIFILKYLDTGSTVPLDMSPRLCLDGVVHSNNKLPL